MWMKSDFRGERDKNNCQTARGMSFFKKGILALSFMVMLCIPAMGLPQQLWNISLNGSEARSITRAIDNGYVFAGTGSDKEYILVKLDEMGNVIWNRSYYPVEEKKNSAFDLLPLEDGYIMCGISAGSGVDDDRLDISVVRTDESGEMIWQRVIERENEEYGRSIVQTGDGGFILAGYSLYQRLNVDIYLLKLNSAGEIVWNRTYGTGQANSIVTARDSGYLVAGFKGGDAYVFKIDEEGEVLWEKSQGGDDFEVADSIIATEDGGYLMAGFTESFGEGGRDFYLLKIDQEGNKIWEKAYGTPERDEANSVTEVEGGYVAGGITGLYPMLAHFLKVDKNGDLLWELDFVPTNIDIAYDVSPSWTGEFIGCGSRSTELFVASYGDDVGIIGELPYLPLIICLSIFLFLGKHSRTWEPS